MFVRLYIAIETNILYLDLTSHTYGIIKLATLSFCCKLSKPQVYVYIDFFFNIYKQEFVFKCIYLLYCQWLIVLSLLFITNFIKIKKLKKTHKKPTSTAVIKCLVLFFYLNVDKQDCGNQACGLLAIIFCLRYTENDSLVRYSFFWSGC